MEPRATSRLYRPLSRRTSEYCRSTSCSFDAAQPDGGAEAAAGELALDDLLGSAAQRAHGGCGDARRPLAEVLGHGLGDDAPGLLHLGDGAVGTEQVAELGEAQAGDTAQVVDLVGDVVRQREVDVGLTRAAPRHLRVGGVGEGDRQTGRPRAGDDHVGVGESGVPAADEVVGKIARSAAASVAGVRNQLDMTVLQGAVDAIAADQGLRPPAPVGVGHLWTGTVQAGKSR